MSPFGKYAAIVAAIVAILVLGGWIVTALHIGNAAPSEQLNAAALLILGAIFGTGAGALTVANGAGKVGAAANIRLDAIGAPSATAAAEIVKGVVPSVPLTDSITAPHDGP